jgi:hypothetical protein
MYKISKIKVLQSMRIIHGFSTVKMIPEKYIFVRNFSAPPDSS